MDDAQKPESEHDLLSCCEVELMLDSYLDGEMDPVLYARFEDHLQACEPCSGIVRETQSIVAVAKTLAQQPIPTGVSRRLRQRLEEETGFHFFCPDLRILESKTEK